MDTLQKTTQRVYAIRSSQNRYRETVYDYNEILRRFDMYLEETANTRIKFTLVNQLTGEVRNSDMEYLHRWTETYKNRTLARLYKLEEWYKSNPVDITFFTFTTHQRNFKRLENQYEFLKFNFQRVRDVMRKMKGKFDYFWVIEPHETGFMHLHMMTFCTWTDEQKESILDIWENKYGAGLKEAQNIQDIPVMRVDYIRTYLFKYLGKTFDPENYKKNLHLFHAVAWYMTRRDTNYTGIRFFGCSRALSFVMKLDTVDGSDDWVCESVQIGDYESYRLPDEDRKLYIPTVPI